MAIVKEEKELKVKYNSEEKTKLKLKKIKEKEKLKKEKEKEKEKLKKEKEKEREKLKKEKEREKEKEKLKKEKEKAKLAEKEKPAEKEKRKPAGKETPMEKEKLTERERIKASVIEQAHDSDSNVDKSVENTLVTLYKLQMIYSRIDKVRLIRGELPLEVSDLEDECLGLQVRIDKFEEVVKDYRKQISDIQDTIKRSLMQISKYKEQLDNVRNNREFDALNKEIEYEELDIQLNEKKKHEYDAQIADKNVDIKKLKEELNNAKVSLDAKKEELNSIIAETEKEEVALLQQAKLQEAKIEPRMLNAFTRIRTNMRNGLATVKVDRNACGGCFSKISPQRQLDIRMHRKIIVCEFCGRILVDDEIMLLASQDAE
jgi:predicted  nucleic acid-binding Zn-ribbon protein